MLVQLSMLGCEQTSMYKYLYIFNQKGLTSRVKHDFTRDN